MGGAGDGSDLIVGADVAGVDAEGALAGVTLLNASGVEVSGGGKGAPFASPRTLRFNGGSDSDAPPFGFLPLCFA